MLETTKKCTKCSTEKSIIEFGKSKNCIGGRATQCKECDIQRVQKRQKTKDGLVLRIYNTQKFNSKRRGHRPPEYNAKELKEWLYSQKTFHRLYSEWKSSGYKKSLIPSVDRKINDVHYCFGNMQLTTWYENDNKENRPVKQLSANGAIVAIYISAAEAGRQLGAKSRSSVTNVLKGRAKTYKGFLFEYVND